MIKPWAKISSTPVGDYRIFTIRSDKKTSPRTGKEHEFYVLETVDWVNVIATTADNHLVMIEQYRHGSNTVELEIPGGMMDSHERSAVETGIRELREETGYVGDDARIIGKVFSNPAILNNTTFTVMVENCQCTEEVCFDGGEDLITRLVPISDIPRLISEGKIRHSLVVVALYHFDLRRRAPIQGRA